MATESATPRSQGYRMPAEWEPHAATWLAWPHNADDWPGRFHPIPWVYCDIIRHLSRVEDVHLLVEDAAAEQRARGMLARVGAQLDRVHFHQWPTNRVWMRDSGPIFVAKAETPVAVTNWHFNAWAKYPDWQLDDQQPLKAAELLRLPSWTPVFPPDHRVVLEGGSIDVNGRGTLITTEECLLSPVQQRNPGLSREDLERIFHDYLGIDQVLWLDRGIAGDDTHGHVDDITRFVSPVTIVTVTEPNPADENHLPLAENLERLRTARNAEGRPFTIVELPMPSPVVFQGQRLPASRQVVGIHCGDLVWGLGTLHCMTQQQPAG
jgi:agmatine deiminase